MPEVLLSGHHENIRKWRHEQSVKRTKREDQIFGKHMRRGWKRKMETGKIKLVAADMDGTL